MNKIKILKPAVDTKSYEIAAAEFAKLYLAVTGREIPVIMEDDGESDLIVIGGEETNKFTFDYILEKNIDGFSVRCGSDEYRILSQTQGNRTLMFLVGGCGRATIYAVYHYFERVMDCRYFWDGDIIPKADEIKISDIDIQEKPRFQYRGLRYFAHRSLHRFQAEHWNLEDWKKEIDWLMKKRINLFMLRIGQDDLFQKAFPDVTAYLENDKKLSEGKTGYNDRTPSWSLQFRGNLRKQILEYAFDRELQHPEDCGTMTHWYTPTPDDFMEKVKPKLSPQSGGGYTQYPSLAVWDIREKENFDNYFKLTETHIREYGKPDLFHTIGFAERDFYKDRKSNMFMKKYVYKLLLSHLKKHYPNSPVLLASWDLWLNYTPQEANDLVKELDPKQAIIFDYTSDTSIENNFTKWGVVHNFPYVFGFFTVIPGIVKFAAIIL